jgi:hypothetical protein
MPAPRPLSHPWTIERHGTDMALPELKTIIAADCPKMQSVSIYASLRVQFPGSRRRRVAPGHLLARLYQARLHLARLLLILAEACTHLARWLAMA